MAQGERWIAVGVALVTAFFWAVAFPPFDFPEAAYFFLTPFSAWVLFRAPSWRLTLLTAFGASWFAWIGILRWLRHFPAQTEVPLPGLVGIVCLLLLAAVVALFGVAWMLAARWALPRVARAPVALRVIAVIGLAGCWVVLEWVRGWVFTGFPWLTLGTSQWRRPLVLQLASLTGTSGLSFVLVLFNLGLVFYLRHFFATRRDAWWRRFCPEFYVALIALFFTIGVGFSDQRRSVPQRVFAGGFVQPAIAPRERWDGEAIERVLEDYALVARSARINRAEVILWPEASTPLPAPGDPGAEAWLENLARELGIPLLMGNLALAEGPDGYEYHNAILEVQPEGGIQEPYYRKRHLVPFGEYVPKWIPFIDKVIPFEGFFTPGTEPTVLSLEVNGTQWPIGPLVCYEDVFPALSRSLVKAGAAVLFVATNDAWYGQEGAAEQHAAHSVMRAVEMRRPVLRAGNMGWSGWIDEAGRIRAEIRDADGSIYSQMSGTREIWIDPRYQGTQSLYVRWGDWFVGVSAIGVLLCALVLRKRRDDPFLVVSP